MGRRAARRCDESRTESQQELPPVHDNLTRVAQPYSARFPAYGGDGGHGKSFNSETRRNGVRSALAAFRADAGPAIGRAGRSTDSPRPQAASAFTRGLWPRAVGRSLAAQARRHRLHRSFARTGVQPVRPPFLRVSVFEAFSVPSVPSVADPFSLSPPELAHAIISVCPSQ